MEEDLGVEVVLGVWDPPFGDGDAEDDNAWEYTP